MRRRPSAIWLYRYILSLPVRRELVVVAVLSAAVYAVYGQTLHHGFMTLDDPVYVTGNPRVLGGLTREGVAWAFTTVQAGYWIPLTWLSFMVDAQLFGVNAAGYHATNLYLHLANSILLLFVLTKMTGAFWRSALVAALFALHPLRVESVAWVSERKDVLSAFFSLLALWSYVAYTERPSPGRLAMVAVWLAFGLMSKAMLVTLPAVLLLLDWWPLGRLSERANPWRLLLEKAPLLVLAIACMVVTIVAARWNGGVFQSRSAGARLATALIGYEGYLGKTVWPLHLAVFYPLPVAWPAWRVVAAALVVGAMSAVAIGTRRRWPSLATGWFWFVVTLLPVIGLVQVGEQAMADRFSYLPLIGLFVAAVWGGHELVRARRLPALPAFACALAVLAALGVLSRRQTALWADNERLFAHAIDVTSDNWLAHTNLGHALLNRRQIDSAAGHFVEALRVKPDCGQAELGLGGVMRLTGRVDEAIEHYTRAVQFTPRDPVAWNNLGEALVARGSAEEAIEPLLVALRLTPGTANVHFNLARALAARGDVDGAIGEYREALRLAPDFAEAHDALAAALAERGDDDEASAHRARAAELHSQLARCGGQ
jgi:protein O-mannosyl-transferase